MQIRLLVVRTPDMERLVKFYEVLGLQFQYHQHGNSPYHYSATIEKMVLEIYPLAKSQSTPDKTLRLGFAINDFEQVIENLKQQNVVFSAEPTQTEFGFLAIIEDPDGRKVELYKE